MYTSTGSRSQSSSLNGSWDLPSVPVHVQFRHMRESKVLLATVHQMAEKLDKFHLEGAQCTVVIDEAHHRRRKSVFEITARLSVPGERLYVAHSVEEDVTRFELHASIVEVFEILERQLARVHDRRVWRKAQQAVEQAA